RWSAVRTVCYPNNGCHYWDSNHHNNRDSHSMGDNTRSMESTLDNPKKDYTSGGTGNTSYNSTGYKMDYNSCTMENSQTLLKNGGRFGKTGHKNLFRIQN